jgi:histone H3/H4
MIDFLKPFFRKPKHLYKNLVFIPIMPKKRILSLNAMERVIREAGALRVSDSAKVALSDVLEERAIALSREAKKLAEHAGRITVTEKDIKLAAQSV